MAPRLYIGTGGFSVWYSDDLGATFERMMGATGLYSESRVWALANHPARPNELLAGTDSGVYRLDVKEHQWAKVPSPMDGMEVWNIAYAPNNPETILCGTRPAAIYRTTDNGATWTKADAKFPDTCPAVLIPRITKIEFDPDEPMAVWAGIEIGGAWYSKNGGRRWIRRWSGLETDDVHDLSLVHTSANTLLFAATNHGLHRTENNGETWHVIPLRSESQYTRTVVPRPDNSGVIFCGNGDGPPGSWGRLHRSRDYGATWEDAGLPGRPQSTAWQVAVNRDDPNLIFAATALGQYYSSTNGGEHWEELPRRLTETRALKWITV